MKRVYTSPRWKRFSASRVRDELQKRERITVKRKTKRPRHKYQAHFLLPKNPKQWTRLFAPEIFSLSENPEGVLGYIENIRRRILQRNQVVLDKSKITHLTPDALLILVASLSDNWFTRNMEIRGQAPADPVLKELFVQSGFLEHVNSSMPRIPTRNKMLHRKSRRKVKPSIVKEVCLIGLNHTFGNQEIFEPLYEMLIECMSNTNFHAGLERQGRYEWWLYVYEVPNTNITSYSFLDLGVGIFDSIPVRDFIKLKIALGLNSNIDLVNPLINGDIKSRTFAKNRGKGIPQIYSHSKHSNIKNFKIIANDVFADFDTSNYYKLKNRFRGTFLYWELHPDPSIEEAVVPIDTGGSVEDGN